MLRARTALAVPGVELLARRQWPTGMASLGVELSGRIAVGQQAGVGRAVGRLDSLGWGGALRELFTAEADGPLPQGLRSAVLTVLDAWGPQVDGVVLVRSAARPQLVEHLAAGIARHLSVPLVGAIAPAAGNGPGRHDVNSAQRLAGIHRRLELDLSEAATAGLSGRCVLLVDDRSDSGWTLTVGARLLRQAGAGQVLPFVLATG